MAVMGSCSQNHEVCITPSGRHYHQMSDVLRCIHSSPKIASKSLHVYHTDIKDLTLHSSSTTEL